MLRMRFVFGVAFLLCGIATSSFAGWFSSSSALTPQEVSEKPSVMQQLDNSIHSGFVELAKSVQRGEIEKGSKEAQVAFGNVYVTSFEDAGYSLDKTLSYCFSQREISFWQHFYVYGDLLTFFFSGFEKEEFRTNLLEQEIVTEETVEAWKEYKVFMKSLN